MEGKALSELLAQLLNPVCFAGCWVSSSSSFLLQFCNAFSSQILLLICVFLVAHQNWVLYMILSFFTSSLLHGCLPVPELAPEVVVICHDFSMYEYRTSRIQWLHFSSSAKRS
jgi:hypothetical protein